MVKHGKYILLAIIVLSVAMIIASLFLENNTFVESIIKFTKILGIALLIMVLAVVTVVVLRYFGKCCTELDRLGSDMSLYAYGIVIAVAVGMSLHDRFLWFKSGANFLIFLLAVLAILFLYLWNLDISKKIRNLNPKYAYGIDDYEQIKSVMATKKGSKLYFQSLILGFFPAYVIILIETFG